MVSAVEHPGLRRDRAPEILRIVGIDERRLDAEPPEAHVELRVGAAVQRLGGHDLVACLQQSGQRDELRRLPAAHRQRPHAAFEGRHPLLQRRRGRVHDARVDVAEPLQVEERGGVRRVLEYVGSGLVDRHRAGAGFGIGPMPGMQGTGGEAKGPVGSGRHYLKVAETERRKQRARPGKIAVAGISPQQDLSRARSNNRQPNQRIPGGNLGVPPVRIMGKGVIRLRTPSHAPISQVLVHWRIR